MSNPLQAAQSSDVTAVPPTPTTAPLTRSTIYAQRFGYAMSDVASNLLFAAISFYLLKFYTDVAGL